MKNLIAIFVLTVMGLASVQAFTPVYSVEKISIEEKVKISPDELPAPVKTTIDNNFADWEITAAYLYTDLKQYEVEFKQEGQSQKVKFDKEGNILR